MLSNNVVTYVCHRDSMSTLQCVVHTFVWSLAISAINKAAPDLLDGVSPYQATTRLQKVRIQLPQPQPLGDASYTAVT